jgi:signal transduction histidine kinase
MAILASLLIGRRVVRPVQILRQGATRIGAGALNHRIDIRTGDELQALAEEFNLMAAQLQESYAGLERRVEERTRELARLVAELQALGEVSQAVSSTLDLGTVLTTIVTRAVQLSGAKGGVIYEYDEDMQMFHLRATHGVPEELIEVIRGARIHHGEGAMGKAAVTRTPVQVPDMLDERGSVLPQVRPILAQAGYRSLLAVPLLLEQQTFGGLVVYRPESGAFAPEVVHLLQTFATQSVPAIQNARLFRELEERGRQLEIASKHKTQFLANMSHELRTPLNAILGYTELILDEIYGTVPDKIRDVLGRVQQSGQHLLGLINAVLDLSKIEAGRLVLSLDNYSMQDVVHTVFAAVESLAAEKRLALNISVPPDLPPGRGDEQRISQVLLNLVGNAIKFTEAGEVGVQVTAADNMFTVAVSDTGLGISEADQQKIFEEFQQADSSSTRKQGGTGLGLAIAKKIIELHGGCIWVESSLGKGSTFWFTLPVQVERQQETVL